jgi:hypothetical protein
MALPGVGSKSGPIGRGGFAMSDDKRDVLEVLKFELSFLEQGGYGRSVRTPWKATSAFQDSPSCLNFNDPARPHACSECLLTDFVPQESREESIPCHFIPLNNIGETVDSLERQSHQLELEEALKKWLRATIARLESDRTQKLTRH